MPLLPALFSQSCVNLPIPEDDCTTSLEVPLTISGVGNNLGSNVMLHKVEVIIDHSWRSEIDLYLKAPNGTEIELSTGNGGLGNHFGDPNDCPNTPLVFASWSQFPINTLHVDFKGMFQPEGNFSDFDGIDPNGEWKLRVCDSNSSNHAGTLIYFDLKFETAFCFNNSGITRLYVDIDANGANDGSSWTNAFNNLQDAIHAATICDAIEELWVAEGTYLPTQNIFGNSSPGDATSKVFFLTHDVKIYGGFDGTEMQLSDRDPAAHITILSGDLDNNDLANPAASKDDIVGSNARNILYLQALTNAALIDGFTISAADGRIGSYGTAVRNIGSSIKFENCKLIANAASSAGALFNQALAGLNANPHFTDCIFENNYAKNSAGAIYAAATSSWLNTDMSFFNCSFLNNTANESENIFYKGGAIYNYADGGSSDLNLQGCLFDGNYAGIRAGAIYNFVRNSGGSADLTATNCIFSNNSTTSSGGGACYFDSSHSGFAYPEFNNCLFYGNSSTGIGGAVCSIAGYGSSSSSINSEFNNCTFYDNESGSYGGALYVSAHSFSFSGVNVSNCIFWGNVAATGHKDMYGGGSNVGAQVSYTLTEEAACPGGFTCNAGMIYNQDPLFENVANHDFHLQDCSPAINAGTSNNAPTDDLDGNPRPYSTTTEDMGAYEKQAITSPVSNYYADNDNDGYGDPANSVMDCSAPAGYVSDNTDCDDNDPHEFPGQTWYEDGDNDNYGGASHVACTRPGGYFTASELTGTGDCNDGNSAINPGATEVCDGLDNDCNSQIDEGLETTFYEDSDNDGFGNPNNTTQACNAPNGYVSDNTDCNDNDANEFPNQTWYKDADGDDYGDGTSQVACTRPSNHFTTSELIATSGDCNDNDSSIHPAATEICDGIDNNCNSQTDEGVLSTFYEDSDGDGYGNAGSTTQACSAPGGYVSDNTDCNDNDANEFPNQTWYQDADGDNYGDGTSQIACTRPANHFLASELSQTSGDCNDNNANIYPGAAEVCDNLDNNCNNQIDEGITFQNYYLDSDGDGFGTGNATNDCQPPSANHVTQNGDCNDNDSAIHPNATEICDNIDNNCNSQIDEGLQTTFYEDSDADGFGNPNSTSQACNTPTGYVSDNTDCNDNDANEFPNQTWHKDADGDGYGDGTSQTACTRPTNHFLSSELTQISGDCNDNDSAIHPNATEVCDGIDNNCNAQTDEGLLSTFYEDADNDGFGNASSSTQACSAPSGYVSDNTDCNDNDANEFPNQTWHKDADGDGYGDGTSQSNCARIANHYLAEELTATSGDCNDGNASINPGAVEVCDGIDNNCNAQTDEGVMNTYYLDADNDNYGDASNSTQACSVPNGYVVDATDCNDNNADEYPGQIWHKDADGDGYGDGTSQATCSRPTDHFLTSELTQTSGDCNDNDAAINPAASETCGDGIDNNCDNQIDEGCCAVPDAVCKNFTAFVDNFGNVTILETDVDGGSTADCGLQSLLIDQNTFDCSHIGNPQDVVLTITDTNGDSDQCTATVTIEDDQKPSISCPSNFTQNVDAGTCLTTVTIPTASSNDNCGNPTLDLRWRAVDPATNANQGPWSAWSTNATHNFDKGKYKFQWRAKDASGNNKKCARYVEVIDNEKPNALCQNVTASLDPNTNQITVTPQEVDNGSTDNCSISMLSLDQNTFDCSNVGTNAVTLTVEDESGNSDQCTADVTVEGATVTIDDISQNEGTGAGFTYYFFKIERSGPGCAINVDYATSDGSATLSDSDYVSGSGTVYFSPGGSNVRYVICRATKDNVHESDEMFYVDLTNVTNGGQIVDNQGEAEVLNDDATASIGNSNGYNTESLDFQNADLSNAKIELYPNPVLDILNVRLAFTSESNENRIIELYDVLERKIGSFKVKESVFTIDVSTLRTGNYYLILKNGEEQIIKRFVKVD